MARLKLGCGGAIARARDLNPLRSRARHLFRGCSGPSRGKRTATRGTGTRTSRRRLSASHRRGDVGYLETDKPENVRFYERFGFRVVAEAPVIGVTSWYMRRPGRSARDR